MHTLGHINRFAARAIVVALAMSVVAAAGLTGSASAASGSTLAPPKKGCSATDVSGCTSDPAPPIMRNAKPKPGYYTGRFIPNSGPGSVSFYVTPDGKSIVGFVYSWGSMVYVRPDGSATTTPGDIGATSCTVKGTTHQTTPAPIGVSMESGAKAFRTSKQALDLGGQFSSSTTVDGGAKVLSVTTPCGITDVGSAGFTAAWKNASQPKRK